MVKGIRNACQYGFTLLELMIVMGISVVLVTMGIASFNNYNNIQKVKQAALTLRNNLRYAQTKAVTAEKPTGCAAPLDGYLVTFAASSYTIRPQCNGAGGNPVLTFTLPDPVTISSPPSPILFRVLNRGINRDTSQVITVTGFGTSLQVTVFASGEIKYP